MEMRPCGLSDMGWLRLARVSKGRHGLVVDKRRSVAGAACGEAQDGAFAGTICVASTCPWIAQLHRRHALAAGCERSRCLLGGAIGLGPWGQEHPTQASRASRHVGPWLALGMTSSGSPGSGVAAGTGLRPCVSQTERIFSQRREHNPKNLGSLPAATTT